MSTFNNANILIVGGAGFVGSNLAHLLVAENPEKIVIVDNLLSSETINIPDEDNVEFLYGSITDDQVLKSLPQNLDYVFHLACYHGNQSSIHDPLADHENNTFTTLKLFEKLKEYDKVKKIVYAAAGCAVAEKTFDDATATYEDAPVSLYHDSPYSISKIIGELYGNYYWRRYDLPIVKTRFQNVYGPREILGAGQWRGTVNTVWRNVTPTFVWKSLNNEALPLDNGGNASRDFIYVEDMARGLMCAALRGEPGEVYNLASGVETTILQLAEEINRITGNKTPLEIKPARDWDRSGKRFGSTEKSYEKLGFKTQVEISEGLEKTIEWTNKNREYIQKCMDKHDYFMKQISI